MVNREEMAPSPRQPLNRQGVLRISGTEQTNSLTTGNSNGFRKLNIVKIGAINISTMRDKEEKIIEVMKERKLTVLAVFGVRLQDVVIEKFTKTTG